MSFSHSFWADLKEQRAFFNSIKEISRLWFLMNSQREMRKKARLLLFKMILPINLMLVECSLLLLMLWMEHLLVTALCLLVDLERGSYLGFVFTYRTPGFSELSRIKWWYSIFPLLTFFSCFVFIFSLLSREDKGSIILYESITFLIMMSLLTTIFIFISIFC